MVDTAYTEGFKAGIAWEKAHRDEMQPLDLETRIAFNKGYYRRQGRKQEQMRIIELLDQKHNATVGDTTHNQSGNCTACEAIALIKGEK